MKCWAWVIGMLLLMGGISGCGNGENGNGRAAVAEQAEMQEFVGKYWGGENSRGDEVYWHFGRDGRLIHFNVDREFVRTTGYEVIEEDSTTYFTWMPVSRAPRMREIVEYSGDKLRIEIVIEEIDHDLELISEGKFREVMEQSTLHRM